MSFVIKNNIKYCLDEQSDTYNVGCGQSKDAIDDQNLDLSTIVIPEKIYGKDITKISASAFRSLSQIRIVQIYAKITVIDSWAFDQCSGIERINIPATVTSIGGNALCFSQSVGGASPGSVHIYIEKGSQLSKIDSGGISSKETIIISYCGSINIQECGANVFAGGCQTVKIYSPSSKSICSRQSTIVEESAICPPYPPTIPITPRIITINTWRLPLPRIINYIFLFIS